MEVYILKNGMIFVLLLTFLFGCQSNDVVDTTNVSNKVEAKENKETVNFDEEIVKVKISNGKTFEDLKSIETFTHILVSAVKENGIVNIANPQYKMDVYTNNSSKSFHLWTGEKGEKSVLMKTDDTNYIYTISEELTDKLIDLIEL